MSIEFKNDHIFLGCEASFIQYKGSTRDPQPHPLIFVKKVEIFTSAEAFSLRSIINLFGETMGPNVYLLCRHK